MCLSGAGTWSIRKAPGCPAAAAGTSMPTSVGRRSGARTRRRAATTMWAFGCSAVPSNRQASERRPGGSGRSHDRRCRSGQVYRHLGRGVDLSNGSWLSTICRRLSISLRRSPGSSKSDRFFMEAGDSSLPRFYHHRLKRPKITDARYVFGPVCHDSWIPHAAVLHAERVFHCDVVAEANALGTHKTAIGCVNAQRYAEKSCIPGSGRGPKTSSNKTGSVLGSPLQEE